MQRCGINPYDYFSIDDFRGIVEFNTLDTLSRIGAATSDIAENNLREIHNTINKLQIKEKKINHTFEENKKEISWVVGEAIHFAYEVGYLDCELKRGYSKFDKIVEKINIMIFVQKY